MMMTRRLLFALLTLLLSSKGAWAAPAKCPKDDTIIGYSDWNTLQYDIHQLNGQSTPEDATFIICPDTTFRINNQVDGNQGLRFNFTNPRVNIPPITLQCGLRGSPYDECVIRGGWHHIWVIQVTSSLNVVGITFDSATRGSVWTGTGSNQIFFQDCIWRNNVYDWNPNPFATFTPNRCPTGCSGAVGGRNGATSFENCQFLNNEGDSGAVYGENMAYTFVGCLFTGNKAVARDLGIGTPPTGSAITLHSPESSLYMSNTCFKDNESRGPATVMVEDTIVTTRIGSAPATSLRVNSNNYFADNRVAESNLDSAFQWCHNSIYNFIHSEDAGSVIEHDWSFDDCVPSTSACCLCEDPNAAEPLDFGSNEVDVTRSEFDFSDEQNRGFGSSGSGNRRMGILSLGLVASAAGWWMMQ